MCRRACELGKKNQWAHSSTFGNRRSVSLHNKRYFFSRFSGERRKVGSERGALDTRDRGRRRRACLALLACLPLSLARSKNAKK